MISDRRFERSLVAIVLLDSMTFCRLEPQLPKKCTKGTLNSSTFTKEPCKYNMETEKKEMTTEHKNRTARSEQK